MDVEDFNFQYFFLTVAWRYAALSAPDASSPPNITLGSNPKLGKVFTTTGTPPNTGIIKSFL